MTLAYNEHQLQLRESLREFLDDRSPVARLRELRDTRDPTGFSRDLWRRFGLMGYAGALVPDAHGGVGLGHMECAIVMQECGRRLVASPFWASSVVCASALVLAGNEAQRTVYLPPLASAESVWAFAIDEGAKHDPAATALAAVPDATGWRLRGTKRFIAHGHAADRLLVLARTAHAPGSMPGLTLFVVDRDAPGLHLERTPQIDSHATGGARFDDVHVGPEAVLGEVDLAVAVLPRMLDAGRVSAAAELLGIADETLARTLGWLKERRQFGRFIGEFQALQHRAARLYGEIELARGAVLHAARALDQGAPRASFLASVAKAKSGLVALLAVQEAVQLHGGMGVTDEMDFGFFMKRVRVLEETLGDHRFHLARLAEAGGY